MENDTTILTREEVENKVAELRIRSTSEVDDFEDFRAWIVSRLPVSYDIQPQRVSDEELAKIIQDKLNLEGVPLLHVAAAVRAAVETPLLEEIERLKNAYTGASEERDSLREKLAEAEAEKADAFAYARDFDKLSADYGKALSDRDLYKTRLEKVVEYIKQQTEKAGYLAGHIITGVVTSIAEGRDK